MSNNKNTINDETWLTIINGTKQPEPDNQEEIKISKIRKLLLDEYTEDLTPNDMKITPEQEAEYAEERQRLLALLKEKNLLDSD